jgi:hypothetical protein
MAASKVISGSGSTAIRYLYVLSGGSGAVITRYTVSSSGIGSPTTINTTAMQLLPTNSMISELELNQDGSKLAWGYGNTADGKVYELATASPNALTTYTLPNSISRNQNIMGVEYDASNNLWVYGQSYNTFEAVVYTKLLPLPRQPICNLQVHQPIITPSLRKATIAIYMR